MKKAALFLICFCIAGNSFYAQDPNMTTARTEIKNGWIEGIHDPESGLDIYLGIPFAEPPVGKLRWKAPQPKKNWEGILETRKFRSGPVQTDVYGDMEFRGDTMSEDCLYLNVWSPAVKNTTGLPVLVYFYGGGFLAGNGSEPRYDGASMAKEGIVVLTVNYRLNIFGFFAHPELSAESPYKASGNYGLLDQAAALEWVQKNISAFGGNPAKVTIAGESAGSVSVSHQMASPLSKNLIAGAIGESGAAIFPTMAPVPLAEGEQIGVEFLEKTGFRSVDQLRALSTNELFDSYLKLGWFEFPAVIDGYFLTKPLPEIFNAGEQAKVPLLVGWNSAEVPGFLFTQGPYSRENYISKIKEAYPDDYDVVLELYPYGSDKELELSATALASDQFISYSTWKWFDLQRKNSPKPVYRYLFCRIRPPLIDNSLESGFAGGTSRKKNNVKMPEPIGAPHATEIEYCMGNLYLVDDYAWTTEDSIVSETMKHYFANFIRTGNPNAESLPKWPAAAPEDDNPPVMFIDVVSKASKATDDARYLFLDKSYAEQLK